MKIIILEENKTTLLKDLGTLLSSINEYTRRPYTAACFYYCLIAFTCSRIVQCIPVYPSILVQLAILCISNTICQEISMLLYFYKFRKFYSVAKLNFSKVLPCHTFYVAHVDHLQKIIFAQISCSTVTVNCMDDSIFALFSFIFSLTIHMHSEEFTSVEDKPEDDLTDDFVKKLLIITQSSRASSHDRTGNHTPRSKLTEEISQAISDGLYFYEQVRSCDHFTVTTLLCKLST